ncbi:hypothetical protein COU13_00885 [Candidatus Kaiserbacteria bacterium CG10_big_fil_rev_8_21_14_0_10_43_70]|uniref:Uncharacterized protein n=1 Tax=Candidatus Kaiserbacteria bacterium CG10_big_fil_rev_8_21_14_0_10_43_70 TaxID=1974605 RepID=A0A2H0UJ68_9BACT|nr:MAG: hypothetical protein COU13_00885 [Candidatus Kaiserbacteria bacterium CG10_big_fil_rev_8_21_14_0_10_43_70]
MSEFWSSFSKWFGEKANSPLYWTYFGFFVAWNWKFFQVIFLEHESLFRQPRIEYLDSILFHPTSIELVNWLVNLIWHVGPPAILTYGAIVWLPKIHHWAFDIYTENLFVRKLAFQKRKVQYEEDVAALTKKEAVAKRVQATQKKEIEKAKTQEEKWQEDFEQIKRPDLLHSFQNLVSVIYKQGGMAYPHNIESSLPNASAVMAFAGTNDLIDTEKRESGSPLIRLTDKGKYFSRLLSDKGIMAR